MNESTKQPTVLITGASRGIGEAAARAFAAQGARLGLIGRKGERLSALAAELGATALPCDVARPDEVHRAVELLRAQTGRLDVLINNAGLVKPIAPLHEADVRAWGTLIDVNVKGVYHGMRAALPVMRAQGAGTIISLSSGAAHTPHEGWSAYCASKAAVAMLTRTADLESRASGVRVMGLAPGTIATDMQASIRASGINPISQLDWSAHGKPEWVGQLIVWMTSPEADDLVGQEVSLRDPKIRARAGIPA